MADESGAKSPATSAKSLPPVEAPNVRMILQLFIVPGLLVALVIGFILVFFGGVGAGPQKPAEFLAGLNSLSGHKRQQTAHDLAQYLPRKPELRADVGFALDLAELLEKEMRLQKSDPPKPNESGEVMDLLEFLPAVVGNFQVPVGMPLLQQLVAENAGRLQEETRRLRFRNALIAIGKQGAVLREFDANPPEVQREQLAQLEREAGDTPGRKQWAKDAAAYLRMRLEHLANSEKKPLPDELGVVTTLALGANSNDELSRKLTTLALANWSESGSEELLRQMTNPGGGIDIFEDNNQERGLREIRYNAALALARRGSPLTPYSLVAETLDEELLGELYPDEKTSPAFGMMLKALRDLQAGKKVRPEAWEEQSELKETVRKLAGHSAVAIRTEATRLLGEKPPDPPKPPSMRSQLLLMVGLAGSIFVFLGIAVAARLWKKSPVPREEEAISSNSP